MRENLAIRIVDTAFDPALGPNFPDRKVHIRRTGRDKPLYKVWIYLTGPDLPSVQSVTYQLHPTFTDPTRTIPRTVSNPNCELVIWTWGIFTVTAIIQDKQGFQYRLTHSLTYHEQIIDLPKERFEVE
jgi:hypothetical protein